MTEAETLQILPWVRNKFLLCWATEFWPFGWALNPTTAVLVREI